MSSTIRNRIGVLLALPLLILTIAARPAQAAGGWTQVSNGMWAKTNSSGLVEEVRIDNDRDAYLDVQIFTDSRGSLKWLGMDRHGGPRIDTWYLSLANGAVYVFLDVADEVIF